MKFALSNEEAEKLNNWLKKHNKTCPFIRQKHKPAIGGRLTYSFKPTSLVVFSKVVCVCGAEEDLTDLDGI